MSVLLLLRFDRQLRPGRKTVRPAIIIIRDSLPFCASRRRCRRCVGTFVPNSTSVPWALIEGTEDRLNRSATQRTTRWHDDRTSNHSTIPKAVIDNYFMLESLTFCIQTDSFQAETRWYLPPGWTVRSHGCTFDNNGHTIADGASLPIEDFFIPCPDDHVAQWIVVMIGIADLLLNLLSEIIQSKVGRQGGWFAACWTIKIDTEWHFLRTIQGTNEQTDGILSDTSNDDFLVLSERERGKNRPSLCSDNIPDLLGLLDAFSLRPENNSNRATRTRTVYVFRFDAEENLRDRHKYIERMHMVIRSGPRILPINTLMIVVSKMKTDERR